MHVSPITWEFHLDCLHIFEKFQLHYVSILLLVTLNFNCFSPIFPLLFPLLLHLILPFKLLHPSITILFPLPTEICLSLTIPSLYASTYCSLFVTDLTAIIFIYINTYHFLSFWVWDNPTKDDFFFLVLSVYLRISCLLKIVDWNSIVLTYHRVFFFPIPLLREI